MQELSLIKKILVAFWKQLKAEQISTSTTTTINDGINDDEKIYNTNVA